MMITDLRSPILIFLLMASPDFNPIEFVIGIRKSTIKKKRFESIMKANKFDKLILKKVDFDFD